MPLSNELITKFVKSTNDKTKAKRESTTYGTIVNRGTKESPVLRLHIDGAFDQNGEAIYQPILSTVETAAGNRVIVSIRNHMAVVTGNLSTPSTTVEKVTEVQTTIATTLDADYLKADAINAAHAEIRALVAKKIDAETVNADFARLDEAQIKYGEFDTLKSDFARFEETTTDDLDATKADIEELEAHKTKVSELIFGSATGTTMQASFANAVIALLGNASIKDALIESLSADKINAGSIDTNKVQVVSEDGSLAIFENLIQIRDGDNVRVQIGKDAAGKYSILVCDESGATMLDASGITENAIKDAIIVNDMIAENANIAGTKIDIDSLITEINENGSQTLKSSKIKIDAENQTLDVAFKQLTDDLTAAGTAITALNNKFETKVWQQDIETVQIDGRNYILDSYKEQIGGLINNSNVTAMYSVSASLINKILGRPITISFDAKADESDSIHDIQAYMVGGGSWFGQTKSSIYTVGPEYTRYSYSITITDPITTDVSFRVRGPANESSFNNSTGGTFFVRRVKLELGESATPWTPAPEDLGTFVEEKVDEFQIGGRNLLKDSRHVQLRSNNDVTYPIVRELLVENGKEFYRYRRTNPESYPTRLSTFNIIPANQITELLTGKEVTFSFAVRCSHATLMSVIGVVLDHTNEESGSESEDFSIGSYSVAIGPEWKRISVTEVIDLDYEYNSSNLIRFCPSNTLIPTGEIENFYLDICEWKIEFGGKATDWSPAPEDIDSELEQLSTKFSLIEQDVDSITTTVAEHTSTMATKTDLEAVNSKFEHDQLVVNGGGEMGNNTNFSTWTFDGIETYNSAGSFTMARGKRGNGIFTDEDFLVNPDREYTLSVDMKSATQSGLMYAFLVFKDIDKNRIQCLHHKHVAASTTTLARDLNPGDTVIYLTDVSGWNASLSSAFYLTIWNYKNSRGYTYPAGTYSRNYIVLPRPNNSGSYMDPAAIDIEANTITLTTAYSGAVIPAGTSVSQGWDGGTYKYLAPKGVAIPAEWTSYSACIGGVDLSGKDAVGKFPPGTAYASVGFLWNNNTADDQIWMTNVSVRDTTELSETANRLLASETFAESAELRLSVTESLVQQLANSISMLVTDANGSSLMTQTNDGWTFSTTSIQERINSTAEDLHNLIEEIGDTNTTVDTLKRGLDDLGVISDHVKIGTYEDEPCIELGEGDSDFKLRITNTRILLMDGSDVPAYISNKSLYITKAVIKEELHQGNWIWKARSNGNLGLQWKGATN